MSQHAYKDVREIFKLTPLWTWNSVQFSQFHTIQGWQSSGVYSALMFKNFFYYLPDEKLLQFVQSCIAVYNDEVFFRNDSGISLEHSWSCWCFTSVPHMWAGKGNSLSRSRVYALGQVLHLCQAISFWVPWTGFSTENCKVCMKKCTAMWMITSSLHRSMYFKIAGTGSWKSFRKMVVVCSSRPKCQLMDKFSSWINNYIFKPGMSAGHICLAHANHCWSIVRGTLSWLRGGFRNRACNRLSGEVLLPHSLWKLLCPNAEAWGGTLPR